MAKDTQEYNRDYYLKNVERIRARMRLYYRKNKEECDKRSRAYSDAHPDKRRLYGRRTYWSHRDHYLEKDRRWKNEHRAEIRSRENSAHSKAVKRDWKNKNRERLRSYFKDYYRKNRERRREYLRGWGKRSPKRRMITARWERIGRLCYICGMHLFESVIVIDHVTPSCRGGSNDISNLMPAHAVCNSRKGGKLNFAVVRPDLING